MVLLVLYQGFYNLLFIFSSLVNKLLLSSTKKTSWCPTSKFCQFCNFYSELLEIVPVAAYMQLWCWIRKLSVPFSNSRNIAPLTKLITRLSVLTVFCKSIDLRMMWKSEHVATSHGS